MVTALTALVLAAAGVTYGWQPVEPGGRQYEYLVQIEPELLDVMREDPTVTLKSYVPEHVTQIRRITITVGQGGVPRTFAGAEQAPESDRQPFETGDGSHIEPAQFHSANREGVDDWSFDDQPNGNNSPGTDRTYPQYGAAISRNPTAISPGPRPVADRFQGAIEETGRTLLDATQYGLERAGEQLQRSGDQAIRTVESVGSELGRRADDTRRNLQDTISEPFGGLRQVNSESGAATNPNWANADGWSSISPDVAAPPLMNPTLEPQGPTDWTRTADNIWNGPSDIRLAENQRESVPASSGIAAAGDNPADAADVDDWSFAAGNDRYAPAPAQQPTASSGRPAEQSDRYDLSQRGADRSQTAADMSGMVPVGGLNPPPLTTSASETGASQATSNPWSGTQSRDSSDQPRSQPTIRREASNAPTEDRYTFGAPNGRTQGSEGDSWAGPALDAPGNGASELSTSLTAQRSDPVRQPASTYPESQEVNSPQRGVQPGGATVATQPGGGSEPRPWMPLLAISVALAGSFGANLFLGWSYFDARHKYLDVVRGPDSDRFERYEPEYRHSEREPDEPRRRRRRYADRD